MYSKDSSPSFRIAGKHVDLNLQNIALGAAGLLFVAGALSPESKENIAKIQAAAAVSNARIEATTHRATDRKDFEFDRKQQAVTAAERIASGTCVNVPTVPHNSVVYAPDGTPLGVGTCIMDSRRMTAVIVDDDGDWNTPGLAQKLAQGSLTEE